MSEVASPFLSRTYSAERNIMRTACKQHSFYLSKVLGEDQEEIYDNLITYIKSNTDLFQSRKATVLIKDKNEDRQVKIVPLAKLLRFAEKKNYHLSPSMVAYKNSDEEECINAIGTREFINNRSFYKGLRQKAAAADDKVLYGKFDKLQNAFKIFNNAQSGAMSSEGTPINNMSGHTSLTSTCRCLTSTANLINEQFVAGNRFYNTPQNTLQSITARILSTDLEALRLVMEKYNLVYPTSADLMGVIKHCSYRYWESATSMEIIEDYVNKLTPLEIASVIYTLDLVSLFRHNQAFVTQFFDDWQALPSETTELLKPDNGDKYVLAISKLPAKAPQEDIQRLNHYHEQLQEKYYDFLHQFFHSPIPPTGLFDVTSSIRDCVLTSDTDSSIYTVDSMIEAYTNDKPKGVRLNAVLTYFIRMISVDQHRQLSVNMNVAERNQRMLGMKNEFYFGAYVTTLMSKHYYALQRMVEGVMRKEPEMEVKGVHLRSSKIAKNIRDSALHFMEDIINALENGEKLDPAVELNKIGELERSVKEDLYAGKWLWLGRQGVKGKKSYAAPMSSVYLYHELWERVFAPKYGAAPDLPYVGIKVGVDLGSKTKLAEFFDGMVDQELAARFRAFCEQTGREKFDGFVLPMERLQSLNDIPAEVKGVMDVRSVIKQNFKSVYAVLESAGLYFMNENMTRLVSDEH